MISPGADLTPPSFGSFHDRQRGPGIEQAPNDGRFFYRVRTQDAMGGNERISTSPGSGLQTVPASYAVVTPDGKPNY
jgi:hypothetical protein